MWRLFWLSVLVAHLFLTAGWWWLEPGGFGWAHPRFWTNSVAPVLGLAITVSALAALRAGSSRVLRSLLSIWAAGWATAAVTARIVFPITLEWLWLVPLAGVLMGVAAVPPWRPGGARSRIGPLAAALGAAIAGGALVVAQRPSAAHTHPSGTAIGASEASIQTTAPASAAPIRLDPRATVYPADGSIALRVESVSLTIHPILTFLAGSKDGCWSILAALRSDGAGATPAPRGAGRAAIMSARLRPRGAGARGAPSCRRRRRDLDRREYVFGHGRIFASQLVLRYRGTRSPPADSRVLTLSGAAIEVRPSDYPLGRPARFAFVEQDRTFRVVEASTGEKGPFRTLARGRLASDDALAITIYDEGRPKGRIALADWAAQADTTLSPTAGWGVPVNAIEFSLSGMRHVAGVPLRHARRHLGRSRLGLRRPHARLLPQPHPLRDGGRAASGVTRRSYAFSERASL